MYVPADKEEKEKSDSGVETQNSEGAGDEEPLGPKCFYNKAKSFFDNVSSELKSRYFKLMLRDCILIPTVFRSRFFVCRV